MSTVNQLLAIANNAYQNGELQIDKSMRELGYPRGDLMADFIHAEIIEVCQGEAESDMRARVINCLTTAITQLTGVVEAIEASADDTLRVATVRATPSISAEALNPNDYEVAGDYIILLSDEVPENLTADAALDVFHRQVPVKVLDDFIFTVHANGALCHPVEEHETYTLHCAGEIVGKSPLPDHSDDAEHQEILPGATASEIQEVLFSDLVGNYDTPGDVPEWQWVEENACFEHCENGKAPGVWSYVIHVESDLTAIPQKLKPVILEARARGTVYLLFHQGH